MTDDEKAELALLRLANEHGKFAIGLDPRSTNAVQQLALERLQLRGWMTLIDVCYVAAAECICRVFLASIDARDYVKRNSLH